MIQINNEKDGPYTLYREDGSKREEGTIINGKKVGIRFFSACL